VAGTSHPRHPPGNCRRSRVTPTLSWSVLAHSGRLALMPASVVAASANSRAMWAAVSGKRRGWQTVGLAGHLTMTTAGVSSASTSSTVMVVVGVIWLEARGVILLMEILLPFTSRLDLLGPAVFAHRPGRSTDTLGVS
jgi:hypothetical protein